MSAYTQGGGAHPRTSARSSSLIRAENATKMSGAPAHVKDSVALQDQVDSTRPSDIHSHLPLPSARRVIPAILGGRRSLSDIICSTGTKNLSTYIITVCERLIQ